MTTFCTRVSGSPASGARLALMAWMGFALLLGGVHTSAGQSLTLSSIEGTVRDETGGALPGVSIVVKSPGLQVQRLKAVTDVDGRYRFPDLPVGTFQLEYSLAGFQTLIRENVSLSTAFVARVDAILKVGGVDESVTVSGAGPVVDLATTRGGLTIATELAARVMPLAGNKSDLVRLTPGVQGVVRDRSPGAMGASTAGAVQSYGQPGSTSMVEGFEMHNHVMWANLTDSQETDMRTYGNTADIGKPGPAMNLVFRPGGNTFHAVMAGTVMNHALQGTNIDDPILQAQGFTQPESLQHYYDVHGSLSGRIIRDRLWFFVSGRQRANNKLLGGFLKPDGTPADPEQASQNGQVAKISYQLSPKYRLSGLYWRDYQRDTPLPFLGILGGGNVRTIRQDYSSLFEFPLHIYSGQFQGAPRNNLTFDAGLGYTDSNTNFYDQPGCTGPATWERPTSVYTGCSIGDGPTSTSERYSVSHWYSASGNVTYIPEGLLHSHTLKAGARNIIATIGAKAPNHATGNYILVLDTVGGVPRTPVEMYTFSLPTDYRGNHNLYSAYMSDQWRVGTRLTANLGLRWERQDLSVPAQNREASTFSTAQSFPAVDIGAWNLWAPRVGLAWDLTGNAKTVLKGTYGWFNTELNYYPASFTDLYNPEVTTRTQYRWHDLNGNRDYDPGEVDLSLSGPDFLSRVGASNTNPLASDFKIPHTHEVTASLERELIPNMAARFLYVYKRLVGQYDTVAVGRPYSAYNIPLQRRDPGPDGITGNADDGQLVTIYDYDPAYRGGQFDVNARLNRPSSQADWTQTLEGSVNKRSSNGWNLGASFGATRQHRWLVGTLTSPNDAYLPIDETWSRAFRLNGGYDLPFGIVAGGTLTIETGVLGQRTNTFRAADPLGGPPLRQLSTVTLRLEPFGSQRGPNGKEVNFRLAKIFKLGSHDLDLTFDLLNALNSNAAQTATYVSGPTFGQITQIPSPRIAQFGVQYRF